MLVKTKYLIFASFILFMSLTAVFAQDNSTSDDICTIENPLNEINTISADLTDEYISDSESGNFTELKELVNGDDIVINLDKDYKYVSGDNVSSDGITVTKSITINGNGHTIDASDSVRMFIINASNVIFNNITFTNGFSSASAGAIGVNNFDNFILNDCTFTNNYATSAAGAVYSSSKNAQINNCTFKDNTAGSSGGAVYLAGDSSSVADSLFESCYGAYGGALYIYGSYVSVTNVTFTSNSADASGGSIYWRGTRGKLSNSSFNGDSSVYGGSIFWSGTYASVRNTAFESSNATRFGGAVYFYASYATVDNSTFKSNYCRVGGAIYSDDYLMTIKNSTFEKNNGSTGGAVILFGSSASVDDSIFKSNTAYTAASVYIGENGATVKNSKFEDNVASGHGGGIYVTASRTTINNSEFINNSASSGAGVYMVYKEENTNLTSNNFIKNSRFINNTARYGGAGVSATDYATVDSCIFTNNSAGNYGGAVDLTNSKLTNSVLENNSAIFGGGIYIYNSQITGNSFTNNQALIGNSIYILNISTLENNNVDDSDVYLFADDDYANVISSDHGITKLMTIDAGYFAYCSERYNSSPYTGVIDNTMEKLKNSITHESVGEYLKILIYAYVDHMDDLRNNDFHDYVWAFTDGDYRNSEDPIVQEVIRLYNSGFRVSTHNATKVLANGTLMYFNFSSMITPSGQQNLFLFQFDHGSQINETLTKEALNKTAIINDTVDFRIIVSNKGTIPIYDTWIEDKDYSKGLVYESWKGELGNWTYNNQTGHWILDVLNPAKSASIILTFRVMVNGTLYNRAVSGVGTVNLTNSTDEIQVYNPNMTVEKITLNKTVLKGQNAEFTIIVRNTGDLDLENVFVRESKYDSGLVYLGFSSIDGNWEHSLDGDAKHMFVLKDKLKTGESASFRVVFTATRMGYFSNTVEGGYNNTTLSNSTNYTTVVEESPFVPPSVRNDTVLVHNDTNKTDNRTDDGVNKTQAVKDNQTSNSTLSNHEREFKTEIDEKSTGNPLVAFVFALIFIPLRRFKV